MNGKDNDNGYDDDDVLWVLDAEGGGFEAWGFWRLGCTHRGRTRFVRAKRQWHHIGRSVTLKLHIYICECDLAVQSESVAKQWDIWGIHIYIIINSLLKRIITKRIKYLKENKTQFNGTKIEDIRLKCPTIYMQFGAQHKWRAIPFTSFNLPHANTYICPPKYYSNIINEYSREEQCQLVEDPIHAESVSQIRRFCDLVHLARCNVRS